MKYGFRIGDVGLLFPSRQDRDKAILAFTGSSVVRISDQPGPRYSDDKDAFSVFDYERGQAVINCFKCKGQFSPETCSRRGVPDTDYMGAFYKDGRTREQWVCDGCMATIQRDHEVWKAKKTLEAGDEE